MAKNARSEDKKEQLDSADELLQGWHSPMSIRSISQIKQHSSQPDRGPRNNPNVSNDPWPHGQVG